MTATYVYGLVAADAELPDGLRGLGPSGEVTTVEHDGVAALVGDVPADRPLGTRDDLMAHENVVDTVAAATTVLPMRFPAVVEHDQVVEELLVPHHDRFVRALEALEGLVQYSLKGRYVQEVLVQEIVEEEPAVAELQERIRGVPEDASYYDRVKLGEIVAKAMEQRRDVDARDIVERLSPFARQVSSSTPGQPDDVVEAAFLVARDGAEEFEKEVEELGADTHEWLRLRLLGPLAPYDFVPED
ncbi:MAG: GvpL/GvpF family gas vesicle protein [Pseudonocardia sp.]|uniref:GvpL/GvpF family gas vesicle protein n=1 Tax=unclassified Pseudonocardia TaxID=2619320 RepID=UPI0008696A2C|nr:MULTISPECIES: GvpL/GvpF family gas vesicle protein [unclassified Pseudonocardia]MBN9107374.1 GvpL/GvpF family gas vesicle protein [Pseudonocardia sp.]ODU26658.1 MAG: gas vesicle synthesis GvpLGvpF [Pseudonocardia sp. SCN 72-51]ODV06611.1 MAG: gas vesicle synthesis GvpLGvpF [Pseudonocardia sp. SCN 73-27]